MSVHVLSWVLRHSPEANPSRRLVLLVLADHASHDGADSYPTIETISWEAKVSRSTVLRALADLETSGAIRRVGSRSSGIVNWIVVMDAERGGVTADTGCQPDTGVTADTGGVSKSPVRGVTADTQTVPKPSSNRSKDSQGELPGMDESRKLIEEWLRVFPGKKPTRPFSPSRIRTAKKVLAEADLPTLVRALEGARDYRRDVKDGSTEFADIFGTFRGTGDLASRINFFAERAPVDADGTITVAALYAHIPSAALSMVRERQRQVEDMLMHPGDVTRAARAGAAEQWLRETWGLRASLADAGGVEWRRGPLG
jgi:hypothetical protein